MERNEFLKSLGLGVALVCSGSCFEACKKGGDNNDPGTGGNKQVSIDISQKLLNIGDRASVNGVLFFRIAAGSQSTSFIATEPACPHQGGTLVWLASQNRIHCQSHSSEYSSTGVVLQQPSDGGSTRNLKIYPLSLEGNTLTATVS